MFVSRGNIYVRNILEETAVSNEILKLPMGSLDMDRAYKLFDMDRFLHLHLHLHLHSWPKESLRQA